MRRPAFLSVFLATLLAFEPILRERQAVLYAQDAFDFSQLKIPANAAESIKDFDRRAQIVIDAAACGLGDIFDREVANVSSDSTPDDELHREELTALVIGKIFKYYQLTVGSSAARVAFRANVLVDKGPCPHNTPEQQDAEATLRQALKADVNRGLKALPERGMKAGSSGLPCRSGLGIVALEPFTHGEYDVVLRNLVRILEMRPKALNGTPLDVLEPDTLSKVRDKLLTLDGGEGLQSYSVYDCGNTENGTGTPQERADHYEFAADFGDFFEDVAGAYWDVWEFLFFLIILAMLVVLGVLWAAQLVGQTVAAAIAAAAAATAAIVTGEPLAFTAVCAWLPGFNLLEACRIPESENHLLMMETSRYLTNEIRAGSASPSQLDNQKNGLRSWMLEHFQDFLKDDFDEYHARPYQRYSINAILNMYDFADDSNVQLAAAMVLDYLSAKFAVGSTNGRRVVPFRRLTDETSNTDLFQPVKGADHQVNRFLVLSGLTGLLPKDDHEGQNARVQEMIYAAVSGYRLPTAVVDLVVDDKSQPYAPYLQRIHHEGVEIYAGARGFLLSAGGVTTGPANLVAWAGRPVDRGAALPTVLIPAAGLRDRNRLIRFEGGEDHDGNTCVTRNFACGLNPRLPAPYTGYGCTTVDGPWRFINSARCNHDVGDPDTDPLVNSPGPYYFVALYIADCPDGQPCEEMEDSCTSAERDDLQNFPYCSSESEQYGFLEAVDVPDGLTGAQMESLFQTFSAGVKSRNPNPAGAVGPGLVMFSYVTEDGRTILFDPLRAAKATDEWGILAVNGTVTTYDTDDWKLGEGEVIVAEGDGIVTFRHPRTGATFRLDLSVAGMPRTDPIVIDRK